MAVEICSAMTAHSLHTQFDIAVVAGASASVRCETWSFDAPVVGYAWRVADPRAVILIQHGFGSHSGVFARTCEGFLQGLLSAGYSVFSFDLPGHGQSEGPRAAPDVRKAVEYHSAALQRLHNLGLPVFVFGHSLGGFITASSVARKSNLVAGTIIASAPFPAPVPLAARAFFYGLALLAPRATAPLPVASRDTLTRDADALRMLADDPLIYQGGSTNRVVATVLSVSERNWPLFRRWHGPVLVLQGDQDASVSPLDSQRFFDSLPAQDKTLRIISGARHDLLNDLDRGETVSLILSWIAEHLPDPQTTERIR